MISIDVLNTICYLAALATGCAYVYGYIIKSKGDRRWHIAGLLFSGMALLNLPSVLATGGRGAASFNAMLLVLFLLMAVSCQALTAFRGRRADRRGGDRADRRAGDPAVAAQPQ